SPTNYLPLLPFRNVGRLVLSCTLCPARSSQGARALRTARSWRGIVAFTHPRTGGAHDSHHRPTKILSHARRRSRRVAARSARAAIRPDAADRSADEQCGG